MGYMQRVFANKKYLNNTMFYLWIVMFCFLLICAAFYGLFLKDALKQTEKLDEHNILMREKIISQQKLFAKLPGFEKQLMKSQVVYYNLLNQLLTQGQGMNILEEIDGLAKKCDMQIQLLKPATIKYENNFYILPVEIIIYGSYPALVQFLHAIAKKRGILTFNSFIISLVEVDPRQDISNDVKIKFMGELVLHFRNTNAMVNILPKQAILLDKPINNLFSMRGIKSISQANNQLQKWPLSKLQLVGDIIIGNQQVALIKTPAREIFPIRKGDFMGQEFGLVEQVDQNEVIITIIKDRFGLKEKQRVVLKLV